MYECLENSHDISSKHTDSAESNLETWGPPTNDDYVLVVSLPKRSLVRDIGVCYTPIDGRFMMENPIRNVGFLKWGYPSINGSFGGSLLQEAPILPNSDHSIRIS